MVKPVRSTGLLVWCLGTFHTVLLSVPLVLLLYKSGALGALLGVLNTLVGVGVFVLLWAITWWSTRRAVAALKKGDELAPPSLWSLLGVGAKWGAVNGGLFILFLLVVYAAVALGSSLGSSAFEVLVVVGYVAVFGIVLAPLVGGLVGLGLALVDALGIWLVSRLLALV